MSEREPDGWIAAWHPEYGWSSTLTRGHKTPYSGKGGWIDKPVCLISPARLAQLEALEDWAKSAILFVREVHEDAETLDGDRLIEEYDTITAKNAGEGEK